MPVALAARPRHFVHAPRRPRVHRRIHIAKREFVGGNLAVRVHVPFAQKQNELLLREMRIDFRERDHVECKVPRRKPRIFPLIRHRDDVAVEKMRPFSIAAEVSLRRRRWLRRIARQPFANDVIVELFAPKQPGITLARDLLRFVDPFLTESPRRKTRPLLSFGARKLHRSQQMDRAALRPSQTVATSRPLIFRVRSRTRNARQTLSRCSAGFTASARPCTTYS